MKPDLVTDERFVEAAALVLGTLLACAFILGCCLLAGWMGGMR